MAFENLRPISQVVLYDALGNPLAVEDGADVDTESRGVLMAGEDKDGKVRFFPINKKGIEVSASIDRSTAISIAIPPADIFREYVTHSTHGRNMIVDGTTPVEFQVAPDPTRDINVYEVRIIITTQNIVFDYKSFVEKAELANGCLLQIRSEDTTYDLENLQVSEDFLAMTATSGANLMDNTGVNDIFAVSYPLPGTPLIHGSGDFVKVTIRDKLDTGQGHIKFAFLALVIGEKVDP
jgi:hypothetical protein